MIRSNIIARTIGGIVAAMFIVVAVAACGSKDDAEAGSGADSLRYSMGEPLTDSSLAAVVISEYGSDTLTAEEFRSQFAMIAAQVPQVRTDADQARELRKNIVEDFILTHAIFGEAERLGVNVDTSAVSERLTQIKARFPTEEAFLQALQSDNITEAELRENISEMLRQEQMLQRMSEGVTDPSEQETMTYREEQAEQVRVSHILFLVPQSAGEQQRDSIRTVADAVLDSVKSEVDFAELARRHSEDGTAQMGGDLGFFGRGAMVEAFEKASFGLVESGDVTEDLVETQYGYHIVKLTGRQTGELMDTTRAREMLMQTRRRVAVQEAVDELRGKVTVRLNPEVVDTDINAQP